MTLTEAVRKAIEEEWAGIVRRAGKTAKRRVYIAFGGLWENRGDPNCLVPYSPSVEDEQSDTWEPAGRDVLT